MRVGLVQFPRAPGERATNLIRTLGAIDRAAAAEPGPDLLILPGQCDGDPTGREPTGEVALADEIPPLTQAMAEAFSESIAARAREWGVYIAFGAFRNRDGVVAEGAALFDPDGDVLLECWDRSDESLRGAAPSCGETPIGRLALRFGQTTDQRFDSDLQAADPMLVVAWFDGPDPKNRRGPSAEEAEDQCRALAARWKVAVCAVFPPPVGRGGACAAAGLTVWCRPGDRPAPLAGRGSNELTMVELI
ncbi:MAG: hypothetical protein IID37_05040 [Planctomycetes bacterium]|nr:hypothetical protein [Planctomycetota bacterium]